MRGCMKLPIYIDIDGTLTDSGKVGGKVLEERIARVRRLIDSGTEVVVWSNAGTVYARNFCTLHALRCTAMGKPHFCVDDMPTILKSPGLKVVEPSTFFGGENDSLD